MSYESPLYLIVFNGMIIKSFNYTIEKDEFIQNVKDKKFIVYRREV